MWLTLPPAVIELLESRHSKQWWQDYVFQNNILKYTYTTILQPIVVYGCSIVILLWQTVKLYIEIEPTTTTPFKKSTAKAFDNT